MFVVIESGWLYEWAPGLKPKVEVKTEIVTSETEYRTIQDKIETTASDHYQLLEQYPQFDSETINTDITAIRDELRQSFKDQYMSEEEEKSLWTKQEDQSQTVPLYYTNYDIDTLTESIYSLRFISKLYSKSDSPEINKKNIIVNTDEEQVTSIEEIFNSSNQKELIDYIRQSYKEEYGEQFSVETFDQLMESSKLVDYIYLTADKINIDLPKEILKESDKNKASLTIEYTELTEYISDDWRQKLDLPEPEPEITYKREDLPWSPVFRGPSSTDGKKRVALTYDDGPGTEETTGRLLNMLNEYNAKATFYLLGDVAIHRQDMAKRIKNEGHEIGNHSWGHPDLTTLSLDNAVGSINKADNVFEEVLGITPKTYRPPYGARTDTIDEAIGKPAILWSIDTEDWRSRNAQSVFDMVRNNVKDGDIILMHDIHPETVEASARILKYLYDEGYEFVTVSELMGY